MDILRYNNRIPLYNGNITKFRNTPLWEEVNGVIIYSGATAGATGSVNGVTYTAYSEAQLRTLLEPPNTNSGVFATICTSLITNMSELFYQYSHSHNPTINLNHWDVSNVTTMKSMFERENELASTYLTPVISNWDVSNVLDMSEMFRNGFGGSPGFNGDLSSWDVSSVTNMTAMFFNNTVFNQDLSMWCVTNIPTEPTNFDTGATNWSLPKPVWGTCP